MYSDKKNSNILTAVLKAAGIDTAVVCPGSRNAPIVHDFCCAGFKCIPVTDERSAGFYALGLSLAKGQPVAVCVTSGSALLNLAPAVAEAFYRHVPLLIVSADRPSDEIDCLQGQTLPQPGALGVFAPCYELPIPSSPALLSLCHRRAAEAVAALSHHHRKPVHVNVPLAEPLFSFSTDRLPDVNLINTVSLRNVPDPDYFRQFLSTARRPLVVIAQQQDSELQDLCENFAVLHESLGLPSGRGFVDTMLDMGVESPDLVIYFGDTLVSKHAKKFLSADPKSRLVLISADGHPHDVSGNLTDMIDCGNKEAAKALAVAADSLSPQAIYYRRRWNDTMKRAHTEIDTTELPYGSEIAVKIFEERAATTPCNVHYANSSIVRQANRHARGYRHVNRGVNGIEGSLSTAAGYSLVMDLPTFCVIGDLSFFYDCNALWPDVLGGNLRILLLNNSRGSIFDTLPGLADSPAFPTLVAGTHTASASGICTAYNTGYRFANDLTTLDSGLEWLFSANSDRPLLLEVKVDSQESDMSDQSDVSDT